MSKAVSLFILMITFFSLVPYSHAVVDGNFVYTQETDKSTDMLTYSISKSTYNGIQSWKIDINNSTFVSTHHIRISDGAPLYTSRRSNGTSVEIEYSIAKGVPTIYTRVDKDLFIKKKIWDRGLYDIDTFPQAISSNDFVRERGSKLKFRAINYSDGEVYSFIVKATGYKTEVVEGESVKCVILHVKLDSWLSSFVKDTKIIIPRYDKMADFVRYTGPSIDGSGDKFSLNLVGKEKSVAFR